MEHVNVPGEEDATTADLTRSGDARALRRTRETTMGQEEARASRAIRAYARARAARFYLEPGEVRLKTNHCHIVLFRSKSARDDAACLEIERKVFRASFNCQDAHTTRRHFIPPLCNTCMRAAGSCSCAGMHELSLDTTETSHLVAKEKKDKDISSAQTTLPCSVEDDGTHGLRRADHPALWAGGDALHTTGVLRAS